MRSKRAASRSICVESRETAIGGVCGEILSQLEDKNFSGEEVFAVHLALEEACINAIKHGNKSDPAKAIRIEYTVNTEKVEIIITDEGEGFDPDCVPDPRCGENIYKPGGRGLLLMGSYMDIIEFNERGNRVRMVKYKEGAKRGGTEVVD